MPNESGETLNIDVQQISSELRIRPEIYVKIVTSFSQTLTDRITALEDALEKVDLESMRRILHEIKGTASNLRLKTITAIEEQMHGEVKGEANPAKLKQGLGQLTDQAEKLKTTVNALRV